MADSTKERELTRALEEAKAKLQEQDAYLQQLASPPLIYGTLIRVHEKQKKQPQTGVVMAEGKMIEVVLPEAADKPLIRGAIVKLVAQTMQVVDVVFDPSTVGTVAIVKKVAKHAKDPNLDFVEVDHEGSSKVVIPGKKTPEEGERVVLDTSGYVILMNLGKGEERFGFEKETNVSWKDIGGLDEAKEELIEAIETPIKHAELYAKYGKRPMKGALLYGSPGCGKTMLAKACATALAKVHGEKTSKGFIYVKGPEILNKYVGQSEATIRSLFEHAREFKKKNGYPALLFVDEADAILSKRGTGVSSDMEKTIVPMFLAEMDGLEESGAFVLLATNRPDVLDPAVVRDGRIDRKIKVPRPLQSDAEEIFALNFKGKPIEGTVKEYSKKAAEALFSEEKVLYRINRKNGTSLAFKLSNLVNGAMVAGIVDYATSLALRRDIREGSHKGVVWEDVASAIDLTLKQNQDLDCKDEIKDFCHGFQHDVVGVQKAISV